MTTTDATTSATPVSPIPPLNPTAPPTAPTSSPRPTDSFFDVLHRSPITRSPRGRVGGVCAGVAEHLGVSIGIVRLVAVAAVFTGIGVPLYLFAWLLLPDRSGRVHLERALRSGGSSLVLLVVAVLALLPDDVHEDHHGGAWLVLVGLLVVLAVRKHRAVTRRDSATQTPTDAVRR